MTYKAIFSDFDGTLTGPNHELRPLFWEILQLVHELSAELLVVSGRSLSWGHFLLTHFPLRMVIMEGGGVILQKGPHGEILEHPLVSDQELLSLDEFTVELMQTGVGQFLSSDSYGRKTDRAVEFYQMSDNEREQLMELLDRHEMNYSISSVHLNFWSGDISKQKAVHMLLENFRPQWKKEECLFIGDAPNDESLFEYFEDTVGVSNIRRFLHELKARPKWVLEGDEGSYDRGVFQFLSSLK